VTSEKEAKTAAEDAQECILAAREVAQVTAK